MPEKLGVCGNVKSESDKYTFVPDQRHAASVPYEFRIIRRRWSATPGKWPVIDPADKPRLAQPWRRLLARAFHLAALALTTTAVGYPAVASADWDIDAYDARIADLRTHVANPEQVCCINNGVVWSTDSGGKCVAPPPTRAAPMAQRHSSRWHRHRNQASAPNHCQW